MPTIELFGSARLIAGARTVPVSASTVGEALAELAQVHPKLVGAVLEPDGRPTPAYAVNLNGMRFVQALDERLHDSDELLIISSLSGG
jgi:molybdopterin converting factor small subunit